MSWLSAHLLSVVLFLPLLGAVIVAILPRSEGNQHKGVAIIASLVTFFVSLLLWTGFDASKGNFQFEERVEWAPSLGISYHLGIDGVALLLILLTTFLGPIVVLSTWKDVQKRVKEFCLALLVLETAMIGTLAALDLVLFYVFWEAMLIPMYLLVGVWGSERRIYAAVKFFLFTFAGSVLMLLAIFYLWSKSGTVRSFDYVTLLSSLRLEAGEQKWLFLAFALAFAIKVPIWPLHTWLPDAHTEAPAAGSILLAGVMLKMGTFGFIRYAMPLFPAAALEWAPTIAWLGVMGIIYGSLMCMAQTDLKRLIAYSSVAHLGFVMLGLSALTVEAASGAVLQMVNHGISTGALFLMIGYLYERTHTRDLAAYGGLAKITPALSAVFLVITLSSIGLPGTNGFVGEFLILIGTYSAKMKSGIVLAVIGSLGVILGAVYMLWMYQRVMLGPVRRESLRGTPDLSLREWVTFAPLLAAIVVIGVFPGPLLAAVKMPVNAFIQRVGSPAPPRRVPIGPPSLGTPPQLGTQNPGDKPPVRLPRHMLPMRPPAVNPIEKKP